MGLSQRSEEKIHGYCWNALSISNNREILHDSKLGGFVEIKKLARAEEKKITEMSGK